MEIGRLEAGLDEFRKELGIQARPPCPRRRAELMIRILGDIVVVRRGRVDTVEQDLYRQRDQRFLMAPRTLFGVNSQGGKINKWT